MNLTYKDKQIADIPSSGTKYVPITVHSADEVKNLAITDISVIEGTVFAKILDDCYLWSEVEAPSVIPYLSFVEENSEPFTLKTYATTKNWDGTLYYSTDTENWTEWNGAEISSSNDGNLYLRGKNNTKITGGSNKQFVLTSNKHIKCQGNIENLLDYETVEQGDHPIMAEYCYYNMFLQCSSLTQAPELPATILARNCYGFMFRSCTSLIKAPELPATILARNCYDSMFNGCASLIQAPELPATTLADYCYNNMFRSCTSLTVAPELLATTLTYCCYTGMFYDCTSLTGKIHCASSTSNDSNKLKTSDIYGSSATIVFDL